MFNNATFNNGYSTQLPADFTPGPNHIIIGRGRCVKQHSANVRFDQMVALFAGEYSAALCKSEKGAVLSKLLDEIYSASPDAGFVKRDADGNWQGVEETLARTTVAQAMRNYLCNEYRSSKQFKSKRRFLQLQKQANSDSSNSSSSSSNQTQTYAQDECSTSTTSTRCVSPCPSEEGCSSCTFVVAANAAVVPAAVETNKDTFSVLYSAFGNRITADPFSPTPLAELLWNNNHGITSSSSWGVPEPRPFAPQVQVQVQVQAPASAQEDEQPLPFFSTENLFFPTGSLDISSLMMMEI